MTDGIAAAAASPTHSKPRCPDTSIPRKLLNLPNLVGHASRLPPPNLLLPLSFSSASSLPLFLSAASAPLRPSAFAFLFPGVWCPVPSASRLVPLFAPVPICLLQQPLCAKLPPIARFSLNQTKHTPNYRHGHFRRHSRLSSPSLPRARRPKPSPSLVHVRRPDHRDLRRAQPLTPPDRSVGEAPRHRRDHRHPPRTTRRARQTPAHLRRPRSNHHPQGHHHNREPHQRARNRKTRRRRNPQQVPPSPTKMVESGGEQSTSNPTPNTTQHPCHQSRQRWANYDGLPQSRRIATSSLPPLRPSSKAHHIQPRVTRGRVRRPSSNRGHNPTSLRDSSQRACRRHQYQHQQHARHQQHTRHQKLRQPSSRPTEASRGRERLPPRISSTPHISHPLARFAPTALPAK